MELSKELQEQIQKQLPGMYATGGTLMNANESHITTETKE